MLGFHGEFAKATNGSLFEEVNQTFSMNEAECKGTEESIENCPHQIISDTDECDIDEAAGVICEGKTYLDLEVLTYYILLGFNGPSGPFNPRPYG